MIHLSTLNFLDSRRELGEVFAIKSGAFSAAYRDMIVVAGEIGLEVTLGYIYVIRT